MREHFRQSMSWLHTWSGLLVGWILYFVFLTGTLGYFDAEIDRWMRPELPLAGKPIEPADAVARGFAKLRESAPGAERWSVVLANRTTGEDLRISWQMPAAGDRGFGVAGGQRLEEVPGETVEPRRTGGGQLLYQMHYRLHYIDTQTATWIVGVCAMFMLVAIISGVITHKKIFRDFFTFRPQKQRRSWLDAHNLLGVATLPFLVMITYSGLVFFMFTYLPLVMNEVYGIDEESQAAFYDDAYPVMYAMPPSGSPADDFPAERVLDLADRHAPGGALQSVSVRNPGDAAARIVLTRERAGLHSGVEHLVFDGVTGQLIGSATPERSGPRRVNDVLIGLHEGLFAGPLLRWLYFASGLAGTAVIATGLVFWSLKRGRQPTSGLDAAGRQLVARLNAATIVGLPVAIAAYFWANRLLPVEFAWRGMWEAHVMFIVWGLALVCAFARPSGRVWIELLAIAAVLYGLLPLLNAMTTGRHLGITLSHDAWRGDWELAAFDLTALVLGMAFGAIALHLRRRSAGMVTG